MQRQSRDLLGGGPVMSSTHAQYGHEFVSRHTTRSEIKPLVPWFPTLAATTTANHFRRRLPLRILLDDNHCLSNLFFSCLNGPRRFCCSSGGLSPSPGSAGNRSSCSTTITMQTAPAPEAHDYPSAISPIARISQPPSNEDWERFRSVILSLYDQQNLPLKVVRQRLLQQYGFKASERMYKSRLTAWNSHKNLKREEWFALALLRYERKAAGKSASVFWVRGRKKRARDLKKYVKSINQTEQSFLRSARESITVIPEYIRAETPGPDDSDRQSPSNDTESGQELSPPPSNHVGPFGSSPTIARPGQLHHLAALKTTSPVWSQPPTSFPSQPPTLPTTTFSPASANPNFDHCWTPVSSPDESVGLQNTSISYPPSRSSATADCDTEMQLPSPGRGEACDQLQRDIDAMGNQLNNPGPLMQRTGSNEISSWCLVSRSTPDSNDGSEDTYLCSRCDQPLNAHFANVNSITVQEELTARNSTTLPPRSILNDSTEGKWQLPTTTNSADLANRWISLCCLACINLKRQNREWSDRSLQDAKVVLEKMIRDQDPFLLSAVTQLALVLGQHDQALIVKEILDAAMDVVDNLCPDDDDPIGTTIMFFAFSTTKCLDDPACDIDSDRMRRVYESFRSRYDSQHPYTVVALYNYGWMLKEEEHYNEAEAILRQAHAAAVMVYGLQHLQSIGTLGALSSALVAQHKYDEGASQLGVVIEQAALTLGENHPYVLDMRRRLAEIYRSGHVLEPPKALEQALILYRQVALGKARVLGRRHKFALGARQEYEQMLKSINRWQDSYTGEFTKEALELKVAYRDADMVSNHKDEWVRIRKEDISLPSTSGPGAEVAYLDSSSDTGSLEHEAY